MQKKTLAGLVTALATAVALASLAAPTIHPERPTTLRALYGLKAPERLSARRTALVLVDFQDEFFHGRLVLRDGAAAASAAKELLSWARRSNVLVVHVRNVAARADSPVFRAGSSAVEIVPELRPLPDEMVIQKSSGGAFTHTELDQRLRARDIDTLVVCGLMTHLAVATSAADATALGYRVVVAADAVATRELPGVLTPASVDATTLQRASLAALADRMADVISVRAIVTLPLERSGG
ncbi:MAG TPA: isochorismatase family protein [Polyangiaceae bacterium]|nr:isochorismatase family protein [Polyangiaceae bacterium]